MSPTEYEILNAHNDLDRWMSEIEKFPEALNDIYYHPEYVRAYEEEGHSSARLFFFEASGERYAYPFLVRTTETICGFPLDLPINDVETAYGYAGPISTSESPSFLKAADAAFNNWCRDANITAEFIRFHPVLRTQRFAAPSIDLSLNRSMYSISIEGDQEPISHFREKARNKIRRAKRAGVVIHHSDLNSKSLSRFKQMYRADMLRINASTEYFFSDSYFASLAELSPSRAFVLSAEVERGPLAMSLFLAGSEGLHYHLSARAQNAVLPGAVNLILESAVAASLDRKLQWLHLGGGSTTAVEDPLRRFKQGLADTEHEYFIGKRVHDLTSWQRAHEIWRSKSVSGSSSLKFIGYQSEK